MFVVEWMYGTDVVIKYKDFIEIHSRIYSITVFSDRIKIRKIDSNFIQIKHQPCTLEASTDLMFIN